MCQKRSHLLENVDADIMTILKPDKYCSGNGPGYKLKSRIRYAVLIVFN